MGRVGGKVVGGGGGTEGGIDWAEKGCERNRGRVSACARAREKRKGEAKSRVEYGKRVRKGRGQARRENVKEEKWPIMMKARGGI